MKDPAKESLSDRADRLSLKYKLTQTGFDSECISEKGDLTKVISEILKDLLPEESFEITETVSADGKQYIAKVKHTSGTEIEIFADTFADYVPDNFSQILESIPLKISSEKRFYMMNPRLLGQEAWYFCGTEANLMAAKKEGLPLVGPEDDYMEMDLTEFE